MIQPTSREAYDEVKKTLHGRQAGVLAVLEGEPDGLAAFEVAAKLGEPKPWVMPRITELRKAGLVERTALRRTDPSTGKKGIVWRRFYHEFVQPTLSFESTTSN